MSSLSIADRVLHQVVEAAFGTVSPPQGAVAFTGPASVAQSAFHVVESVQGAIGAAALGASHIGALRGMQPAHITVDSEHAVAECSALYAINGKVGEVWDKFSGLYSTSNGWVRAHTNFDHHRDGFLDLVRTRVHSENRLENKAAVQAAILDGKWTAQELEDAAAQRDLVVAKLRSFTEWDALEAAAQVRAAPLLSFQRLSSSQDRPILTTLPSLAQKAGATAVRPLDGLRVLDLTRILAGPVGCKTLALHGADVLMVNSPNLPNIDFVAEASQGKRSCHIDLRTEEGKETMAALIRDAHVLVQAYRPGGLDALGYGFEACARLNPNIIYVSLSAYGDRGPWGNRRGFDSLVQTATGFNDAEGKAANSKEPKAFPFQALDFTSGFLIATAVEGALARQLKQAGGALHIKTSLARVGLFIRELGQLDKPSEPNTLFFERLKTLPDDLFETQRCGFNGGCELRAVKHAAECDQWLTTPRLPSLPPGSHSPSWSAS